jgi:hypothetical protein
MAEWSMAVRDVRRAPSVDRRDEGTYDVDLVGHHRLSSVGLTIAFQPRRLVLSPAAVGCKRW